MSFGRVNLSIVLKISNLGQIAISPHTVMVSVSTPRALAMVEGTNHWIWHSWLRSEWKQNAFVGEMIYFLVDNFPCKYVLLSLWSQSLLFTFNKSSLHNWVHKPYLLDDAGTEVFDSLSLDFWIYLLGSCISVAFRICLSSLGVCIIFIVWW